MFISVDAEIARKAAAKLRDTSNRLEGQVDSIGVKLVDGAWVGIKGAYSTSKTPDGDGLGDRGAGSDEGPFWLVEWSTAGGGTFGGLKVFSEHPYVMGFEYGTPEHAINPGHPQEMLHFTSLGAEWFLGDNKVLRAHMNPHHRQTVLEAYLLELGRWGWSRAVWAFLESDLGQNFSLQDFGPPTPPSF